MGKRPGKIKEGEAGWAGGGGEGRHGPTGYRQADGGWREEWPPPGLNRVPLYHRHVYP